MIDLSNHTFLLVDDNEMYRAFMKKLLEYYFKVNVVEADNPKKMFEWLKSNRPSLIILDMEMPYMDGLTALQNIRKINSLKDLPVIACTALSSVDLLAKLLAYGIADYIVKSSDSETIVKKIANFVHKNPALFSQEQENQA